MRRAISGALSLLVVTFCAAAAPGCAFKRIALHSVANSLAEAGDTFGSDPDPELIRVATPFSLKLLESLLAEVPNHRGLLLAACSGFTQYAYAFVDLDAQMLKLDDYPGHAVLLERARKLYLRARDYCLRSLELMHPGIGLRLAADPEKTLRAVEKKDVPLLYWTGASWGKALALSLDRPAHAGDLPIVQALVRRALLLNDSFGAGAIHEAMITLESLPSEMGGSRQRAERHYHRAIELSHGTSASPHLSYATSVLLPQQRRSEFVAVVSKSFEVDVERESRFRIANALAQRYARFLLEHLDELFLSDKEVTHEPPR